MNSLDFSHPPLAFLDAAERQRFDRACDIAYFPAGSRPLRQGEASKAVYWVIKGQLHALREGPEGEQRLSDYGPGDVIGAFAVLLGAARFTYEVAEDALCHAVDAEAFTAVLRQNRRFAAWFQEGLAAKRQVLAEQEHGSDLAETMLTRVGDAQLAPAVTVPPDTSLRAARQAMKAAGVSCLLVQEAGAAPGIITRTDVLDALALEEAAPQAAITPWVRRPLVAVGPGDVLFLALVKMTEHHVERVVVADGEQVLGTLGLSEVLSHYTSHSHLIGLQLARARSVEEIAAAALRLPELLRVLHAQGAKMSYLMALMSALNGRILRALFEQIVPAALQSRVCLLVLGSEGRSEQILRTDQDNALLVEDGVDDAELVAPMQAYSEALLRCGYPPCPGGVMVSQRAWRGSLGEWRQRLAAMGASSDRRGLLDLAILLDARPVAGDEALFQHLRPELYAVGGNDIVLHHFAAAALEFATPLTLFGRLRGSDDLLDIKKGGVFPIVHGLRALALKQGVQDRNSFDRAEALRQQGVLEDARCRDLQQALAVFLRLRLGQQLDALRRGEPTSNLLRLSALRRLDRELLRDALGVVEQFKAQLRQQFHL